MRSRYTAFATGDRDYLLRTWHPRTRPRRLDPDPERRWVGLAVLETRAGGLFDQTGEVRFQASFRSPGQRGILAECSRFARVDGRWLYVDGDVGGDIES